MTAKQTTAEGALERVAVCVQKTGWISEGDAATLRRVIEAARKVDTHLVSIRYGEIQADEDIIPDLDALAAALKGEP
jgi:hypothetical protein